MIGGVSVDMIEAQRDENKKVAATAAARFDAAAKRNGLSAETVILDSTGGAAHVFGRMGATLRPRVAAQADREHGASRT